MVNTPFIQLDGGVYNSECKLFSPSAEPFQQKV